MDIPNKNNNNNGFLFDDFSKFNELNGRDIFIFVTLIIISISVLPLLLPDNNLNIFFGIIIALIIFKYIYDTKKKKNNEEIYISNLENDYIVPKPKICNKYNDIVKFLFSIQDLYKYNQQTYENLIDIIDNFFYLYEESLLINNLSANNYDLMDKNKNQALNLLHSIIINVPADTIYNNKIDDSVDYLNFILSNYLENIYYIYSKTIYVNGLNSGSKILLNPIEPKPATYYNCNNTIYDKHFSFY